MSVARHRMDCACGRCPAVRLLGRWPLRPGDRVWCRGGGIGVVCEAGRTEVAVYFEGMYGARTSVMLHTADIVPIDAVVRSALGIGGAS